MKRYMIAGGGVAGVTAAKEIKKLEADAIVDIYCNESYPYYYRPRLWEFIAGKIGPEDTYYRPVEWYVSQGIGLHLGTCVLHVNPEIHQAELSDGTKQTYDRLLISAGSSSFIPPVEGVNQVGVFALRSLKDAKSIVEYADHSKEVVLIGGGLLGLETARALADRGLRVTVVEYFPRLLPRQLDEEGAAVLESHLDHLGMTLLTGESVKSITAKNERLHLSMQSGAEIMTDMVVFSAGIRSNIHTWQGIGLDIGRGIKVDEYLQTNLPDIFAAGDVAEYQGVVYGIIPAATDQGAIAAANMVNDKSVQYAGTLPSTKLKVAGMEFSSYGESTADGDDIKVLRRSEPDAGSYLRLALRDGILIGVIILGDSRKATAIKKVISAQTNVGQWLDQLLDDDFNFNELLK